MCLLIMEPVRTFLNSGLFKIFLSSEVAKGVEENLDPLNFSELNFQNVFLEIKLYSNEILY